MARPALTAVYFILTFLGGAAVGSWTLWVYLMGAAGGAMPLSQPEPAPPPPSAAPVVAPSPPAPVAAPVQDPEPEIVRLRPPETQDAEVDGAPANPAPPPRREPIAPVRSHEECLALTKELNDAYKDCRFGTSTQERRSQ